MIDLPLVLLFVAFVIVTIILITLIFRYYYEIQLLHKDIENLHKEIEKLETEKRAKDTELEALRNRKEMDIKKAVELARKETADKVRSILKGKIGEQFAPLLEEFYKKYELSDARFIGEPIDYIIFENLTKLKKEIENKIPVEQRSEISIVFAEIKTGKADLNTEQRKIKNAVEAGRVKWDRITLSIPAEMSSPSGGINNPPLLS